MIQSYPTHCECQYMSINIHIPVTFDGVPNLEEVGVPQFSLRGRKTTPLSVTPQVIQSRKNQDIEWMFSALRWKPPAWPPLDRLFSLSPRLQLAGRSLHHQVLLFRCVERRLACGTHPSISEDVFDVFGKNMCLALHFTLTFVRSPP